MLFRVRNKIINSLPRPPPLLLLLFILIPFPLIVSPMALNEKQGSRSEITEINDSPEESGEERRGGGGAEIKFVHTSDEEEEEEEADDDEDISELSPIGPNTHQSDEEVGPEDKCPPPPKESLAQACEASKCTSDSDCSRKSSTSCCFNGCVRTCLRRIDPPRAFDWVEETVLKEPFKNGTQLLDLSQGQIDDFSTGDDSPEFTGNLKGARRRPETVFLPGGCYLTFEQNVHLQEFKKNQHVHGCSCLNGEVVCDVKPVNGISSSSS